MAVDAKKLAAAIVAKSKNEGAEDDSAPSFYEVAAGNIISAVKSGDAKALASSLREFSAVGADASES